MVSRIKYYLKTGWHFLFPTKKILTARIELKQRIAFYTQFIKQDNLCFDIGANYGNRIEPLLAIGAKVVAVEPQRACHQALQSRFGKKIEIVPMGIGAEKGVAQLHIANTSTISSFSLEWIESVKKDRFKDYFWNQTVNVEMTTLDALIEIYGVPTFIKIDVEGYESEVLKGLSHPVQMLSFEYTVPEQVENVKNCIARIQQTNPNIECNFSIGESMQLFFDSWISPREITDYIDTEEFQQTLFGDIYCRTREIKMEL